MTRYSKKLTKYTKNIKPLTKRRRYRRKNSMQNKILYGGDVRTLTFTLQDETSYILTKTRVFNLGISGAGKYKLDSSDNKSNIPEMDLKEFILKLLSIENINISQGLLNELEIKHTEYSFHFKSLYDKFNNLKYIIPPFRDDRYTEITIDEFSELLDERGIIEYIEKLDDDNMFKKNYTKLKKIYDDIRSRKELGELKIIYGHLPLYKINPKLQRLEQSKTLGSGGLGNVYQVSFDGKICALKVITKISDNNNYDEDIKQLTNSEVFAYNNISQLVCDKDNKLFCKFINTYINCDNRTYNIEIYILMEYCGDSLKHIMNKNNIEITSHHIYQWLLNTAKGLKCMHQNNYAHLDIKPANIVIDELLNSKLIDFGLALHFNQKIIPRGTDFYIPPEMAQLNIDISLVEKCDVYSLGISFIECLYALDYHDTYIQCLNTQIAVMAMNVVMRYVPPINPPEPQPPTDMLNLFFVYTDEKNVLIKESFNEDKNTVIFTKTNENEEHAYYRLGDLYIDIMTIHTKYPILRRMIIEDPNDRCSIDEVISAC
jgi:serine/threonine protein kinase